MIGRRKGHLISRGRGFTLIELMVAVAIIAILAATAIPAYNTFIKRAKLLVAEIELTTALKDFGVKADYHPASGMLADLVSEGYLSIIPNDPWSGISDGPMTGAEEAEDWYYVNDGSQLYLYAKTHPGRLYTLASFGLPPLVTVDQTTSGTSSSGSGSSFTTSTTTTPTTTTPTTTTPTGQQQGNKGKGKGTQGKSADKRNPKSIK